MLSKAPEELESYSPRSGFEMIARNMILASNAKDRNAAVAVAVFKEVKEALGEKVGTNWRQTVEDRQRQNAPTIVVDMPMPNADVNWLSSLKRHVGSVCLTPRPGYIPEKFGIKGSKPVCFCRGCAKTSKR
jgi:hypothetical protein